MPLNLLLLVLSELIINFNLNSSPKVSSIIDISILIALTERQ
ncbi:hypothetical protein A1OE_1343 [Candidatus Endolissoclinum faulkneri L2]|uniref:Uncharacterized protein n=1 Tax=Candidatus Endolissoclinum faulkneri L2 TaxID=1193729 RepID=K7ZDH1_9PROT|nr:hypothetical protein A1OE_1343 [Candidatus Endolissoclinum faulkneri L2]